MPNDNLLTDNVGSFAEVIGNLQEAMVSYESALRHNPQSIRAMNAISIVLRAREDFPKAAEFLHQIIKIDPNNGEAWGSLGKLIFPSQGLRTTANNSL